MMMMIMMMTRQGLSRNSVHLLLFLLRNSGGSRLGNSGRPRHSFIAPQQPLASLLLSNHWLHCSSAMREDPVSAMRDNHAILSVTSAATDAGVETFQGFRNAREAVTEFIFGDHQGRSAMQERGTE